MYRYTKNCIFCGRSPTTKEDVWPTWLTQYIPRSIESYHDTIAVISPTGEISKKRKKWSGDPRSRRAQCVCATCNSGWMSRLQEGTKPLLLKLVHGEDTRLTPDHQRLLASWATMSAITSEYIVPETAAISSRDRDRFYKNRSPLKLWRIWIGNYERGDWKPHRIHDAWPTYSPIRDQSRLGAIANPNTQTTTLVFGKLFLHVASSDIPDAIRRMTFPDQVTNTILKGIWPLRSGAIRWPPRQPMTDRDADNAAGFIFLSMTGLLKKKPSIKL